MQEERVYRSGVPRKEALASLALAVVPTLCIVVWTWPPSASGAVFFIATIAFDFFLLWDVFLAPASEVRVRPDSLLVKSPVKEESVPLGDLVYAKADPLGRPEIGWKDGKRKLNIRGDELRRLLGDISERNSSMSISGLKGS